MTILLEERNGVEYLGRVKRIQAGSKNTREDLSAFASVALSYYVDIMDDFLEIGFQTGTGLNTMVRCEEPFAHVK